MKKVYFLFFILFVFYHNILKSQGNAFFANLKTGFQPIKIEANQASNNGGNKIYARLYGGIGLPMAKTNLGTNTTQNANFTTTSAVVNGSYGQGTFFGIGAGFRIYDNFGIGLDIVQFIGKKYTFTSTNLQQGLNNVTTNVSSISGLSIKPALTFFAQPYKSITPFGELGMNLGLTDNMTTTTTFTNTFGMVSHTNITEKKTTPSITPGVFAGVGASIRIAKTIGIFIEVQGLARSFMPKSAEITSYTVDGSDKLSTLNVRQKQTNFSKSLSTTSNDPTKPTEALASRQNYSSLNLMFGVCFGFGNSNSSGSASNKTSAQDGLVVLPPPARHFNSFIY